MSTSVWGVEHGVEISKAKDKSRGHVAASTALGATLGWPGSGIHAAVKAKKGRKAGAALRSGGGAAVGAGIGAALGAGIGARGGPGAAKAASYLGTAAGGGAGAGIGASRNVKVGAIRGMKPRKKG
jgi:hypothetical protein